MSIFTERIPSPPKSFWTNTSADSLAVANAKKKFSNAEWAALGEETQNSIIASLSSKKGKVKPSIDLISEMTKFIADTNTWNKATFEARKEAVRELLSEKSATVETVDEIKGLIAPVSYKTLGQWLEGVEVTEEVRDYINTKAAEASAKNEAANAATKS